MASPVALKQAAVDAPSERATTADRSESLWRTILAPLASLKLTVVLFALAIFLVFASTLAQTETDVWDVIRGWYRVDSSKLLLEDAPYVDFSQFFVKIPGSVFYPDAFFPNVTKPTWAMWFPRGWVIGLFMLLNLVAAHAVRFTVQSRGTRLAAGCVVLALGAVVTWLTVQSGSSADGILGEALIGWNALWKLLLVGLAVGTFASAAAFWALVPERRIEKALAATGFLICGSLLGYALYHRAEPLIGPESMRILWQLLKGTAAGLVLLAGCQMVFKKRAGVVLLHGGVLLMFLNEIIVGTMHDENQMTLVEGAKSNWVQDYRSPEFALSTTAGDNDDRVIAVPKSLLKEGETLALPDAPFDARIVAYYQNSSILKPDDVRSRRAAGTLPPNPATAGFGPTTWVDEVRPVSGVEAGDNADTPSMYVELIEKAGDKKSLGTYLISYRLRPDSVNVGDKEYLLELRPKRTYKSYVIEAKEVRREDHIAGTKPRDYTSVLHVVDESRGIDRIEPIKMNNPMRFAGETFYQMGFQQVEGQNVTTIQVVSNQGWMIPYVSCMIVAIGMLMQFGAALGRFSSRRQTALQARETKEGAEAAKQSAGKRAARRGAEPPLSAEAPPVWREWLMPGLGAGLVLMMIGYTARPTTLKTEDMNLTAFGELPVAYESRVKPIDSMARSTLAYLSHRQTYKENLNDEKERSKPAVQWFLEMALNPKAANDRQVFRIDNLDVLKSLGLERNEHSRYSLNQLIDNAEAYQQQLDRLRDLKDKGVNFGPFEREIEKLSERVQTYRLIQDSFIDPEVPVLTPEDQRADADNPDSNLANWLRNVSSAVRASEEMQEKQMKPPLALPDADGEWQTYTDGNLTRLIAEVRQVMHGEAIPVDPAAVKMHKIFAAYRAKDAAAFNAAVADYRNYVGEVSPPQYDPARRDLETYLNQADPFFWSSYLYVVAGIVACGAWLGYSKMLNRTAFAMILAVFAYHTVSLILRMYVTERPPVTNLYSSAVFIGWGAVLLGIILEAVYKIGFGNVLSAIAGFGSLQIAYLLTRQGDTIQSLEAVLDTQFWLTTHVVCITLGYSTTFAAGLLGAIYLVKGIVTTSLTASDGKALARMIYGTLCFALFFSFVGTVLGGLWADDSWGRFWGWDPKENGALIIVLWNALILHARWDGMVKDRGMAVLAVAGNITTSWSWFGVNQLGVGQHAYGFSQELLMLLSGFVITSAVFVVAGLLPRKYWLSGEGRDA